MDRIVFRVSVLLTIFWAASMAVLITQGKAGS